MMGKQDKQQSLFLYNVNLEERVPPDHPLRKIKSVVDFSFVRAEVFHTYGHNGHESVDPETILKIMFLLFFYDIKSERRLMDEISLRLDFLWFLDFRLDDPVPDHSVLSKARRRWGPDVFEELFVRTVKQCVEAGLVGGSKLHFDGSLVDADASNNSVTEGAPELIAQLRAAYRREEHKFDDIDDENDGDDDDEAGGPGAKSYYQKKNDGLVSSTDPDAAVVSKRGVHPRLRYKNHRAVDDAEGVITSLASTSGDVEENAKLIDLIEQSEQNTGVAVRTAVADSQYGTVDNFRECAKRGIKSHMADLAQSQKNGGRKSRIFEENDFSYDPEKDVYICPAGNVMKRRRHKKKRRAYEYTAGGRACNACELKPKCTRAKNGRSVKRHEDQELVESARAESHSDAAKRDRVRRKHIAEGSFADAANNHGFKRSRWRRLWRQRIQDLMIAACQNLRILISHLAKKPADTGRMGAIHGLESVKNALSNAFHLIFESREYYSPI